jgi:Sir2- and TIR-associating SLOG family/SIR2-like domain
MAELRVERFLDEYLNDLEAHSAAVFAGAGLSVPAGFVDWKSLLAPLARDINLDVAKEDDLVSLAQYHVTAHGNNRADLNERILNEFSRRQAKETLNHKILARLPIHTYWTTNYDNLIETALRSAGKLPDVKHSVTQLPHTLRDRDAIVYKMHGDVEHPHEAVITKADYEVFHVSHAAFLTGLAGDLISKTFLFLGFSFTDPNLHYVLSRLRIQHGEQLKKHFCILKKESARPDDKPGDLEYRATKQALFVADLLRYNIRCLMVNSYDEITGILLRLEALHKKRTVFVSGAAAEYGRWPKDEALSFVHSLGDLLIAEGHRIVSGLGLGIGANLIDGALTQIYHTQKKNLKDQLVIRPFPQSLHGKTLWTRYREDMLDYAGVALFLFGNKVAPDGTIALSDGMQEEFEIARVKGLALLPLGFSGYVARTLWDEVKYDLKRYFPKSDGAFQDLLDQLGDEKKPLVAQLEVIRQALRAIRAMQ